MALRSQLFLGIAADLIRQRNLQDLKKQEPPATEDADLDVFSLLLDPDGNVKLKRALAQHLAASMASEAGLGRTLSTILNQGSQSGGDASLSDRAGQGQEENRHLLRCRAHGRLRRAAAWRLRLETNERAMADGLGLADQGPGSSAAVREMKRKACGTRRPLRHPRLTVPSATQCASGVTRQCNHFGTMPKSRRHEIARDA